MNTMRIQILAGLALISLLVGCTQSTVTPAKEDSNGSSQTTVQTQEIKTQETQVTEEQTAGDVKFSEIKEIPASQILDPLKKEMLAIYSDTSTSSEYTGILEPQNLPDNVPDWQYISGLFHFYEVGDIVTGKYSGQKLVILKLDCDGMCMYSNFYRIAYDGSKMTMLKQMASEDHQVDLVTPLFADVDNSTVLSGVLLPDTIKIPGTSKYITKDKLDYGFKDILKEEYMQLTEIAFTNPVAGKIYFSPKGITSSSLYAVGQDGTVNRYAYDPQLFNDEKTAVTLQTTDGDNLILTADYGFRPFGCGASLMNYGYENIDAKSLKSVGITSSGTELFEVANPVEEETSADPANLILNETYKTYTATFEYVEENKGKSALSFDAFVKEHPVMFFADPFNRWVVVLSNKFKPAAECGKPVIYLYPENTTDITVKVGIDKFTETIPAYGNGWTVKAEPNGSLYNYADGNIYPYLYWEGTSEKSVPIEKGFVVARNELKSFLDASLAKMGLNKQESTDFEDFWISRMLDNSEPYFYISFIGTRDFNKVAPLTITPAPDTLIRVFMFYQPVKNKYMTVPQELSSIPRKGFTVIEWGGTSTIPWKK